MKKLFRPRRIDHSNIIMKYLYLDPIFFVNFSLRKSYVI